MMNRLRTPAVFALAAALATAGCGDDPTVVGSHFDVEGFAILEGATEVYRYMLDDGAPGPLVLEVGARDVVMVLLDQDGQPMVEEQGSGEDHEHVLAVDITDPLILTWTPEAHDHAGDHIEFEGQLNALAAGTTTMRLCVPHGSHCDFEVGDFEGGSGGIPVTVTAASP